MQSRTSAAGLLLALAAAALSGCSSGASHPSGPVSPAVLSRGPVIERTEPWNFLGRPGKLIYTAHYRIYTTELDPVLLGRLPLFVESAMQRYRTAIAPLPEPPMRLDTFVLASRREWVHLTRRLTGSQAGVYLAIQRGGYSFNSTAALFDIGTHDTMSIAAHEGWHQYTQRTFKQRLPTWLEEGIATYMEGHRWNASTPRFLAWANTERFDQLRAASASGTLLPLESLLTATPKDLLERQHHASQEATLTYYAQIWALVHFLMEGESGRYRPALEHLISDAAEGRMVRTMASKFGQRAAQAAATSARGPLPVIAYFNKDMSEISRQYDAFVERIVRPGARGKIVRGRSPVAAD